MNKYLKMAVINYLFYKKNIDVGDASKIYFDNENHFTKVYDVLGSEFVENILKCIKEKK